MLEGKYMQFEALVTAWEQTPSLCSLVKMSSRLDVHMGCCRWVVTIKVAPGDGKSLSKTGSYLALFILGDLCLFIQPALHITGLRQVMIFGDMGFVQTATTQRWDLIPFNTRCRSDARSSPTTLETIYTLGVSTENRCFPLVSKCMGCKTPFCPRAF